MIYQTHLLVTKILTISKKVTVYCYSETRENIYLQLLNFVAAAVVSVKNYFIM